MQHGLTPRERAHLFRNAPVVHFTSLAAKRAAGRVSDTLGPQDCLCPVCFQPGDAAAAAADVAVRCRACFHYVHRRCQNVWLAARAYAPPVCAACRAPWAGMPGTWGAEALADEQPGDRPAGKGKGKGKAAGGGPKTRPSRRGTDPPNALREAARTEARRVRLLRARGDEAARMAEEEDAEVAAARERGPVKTEGEEAAAAGGRPGGTATMSGNKGRGKGRARAKRPVKKRPRRRYGAHDDEEWQA